jgi:hypothetical protein
MQFFDETNMSDTDTNTDVSEEEQVFRRLAHVGNIHLPEDDPDLRKIGEMQAQGCGCKNKCVFSFSDDVIYNHILNIKEMSKEERDMYTYSMGSLAEHSKETTKQGKKIMRSRQTFMFSGEKICKKTFMLAFDIGKHLLQNITTHMNRHGVTPHKHGNNGKKPSHSLKCQDIRFVVQFISSFADDFRLPQTAAPRGRDAVPPIYIPSDKTKETNHEKCVEGCPNY